MSFPIFNLYPCYDSNIWLLSIAFSYNYRHLTFALAIDVAFNPFDSFSICSLLNFYITVITLPTIVPEGNSKKQKKIYCYQLNKREKLISIKVWRVINIAIAIVGRAITIAVGIVEER